MGTIDYEQMDDPSGLYWKPRQPSDARILLGLITQFSDWLARQNDFDESRINPWRQATTYEQKLAWCAWYHKKEAVFLSHLMTHDKGMERVSKARTVAITRPPPVLQERFFRFPESRIEDLLTKGLVRAYSNSLMPDQERLDYKCICITLLLHYGGLRISEVMHLYCVDITLDPHDDNAAQVQVYHPVYGQAPDSGYINRKDYLQRKYGLKPRTEYRFSERLFAGWKIPLLTDSRYCFEVFFAPDEARRWFLQAWINYLKYQRIDPPKDQIHPYAFTTKYGTPETIKNFRRLHAEGVKRIGLDLGKYNGTTEHGHRHSYGYRLAGMSFDECFIQKAMHHQNPHSCLAYVQHTNTDIRDGIRAASPTVEDESV